MRPPNYVGIRLQTDKAREASTIMPLDRKYKHPWVGSFQEARQRLAHQLAAQARRDSDLVEYS